MFGPFRSDLGGSKREDEEREKRHEQRNLFGGHGGIEGDDRGWKPAARNRGR